MTPAEQEAFNARRAARSRVIGLLLGALVILFFLISIVRMRHGP
jgi:hypothetical protein